MKKTKSSIAYIRLGLLIGLLAFFSLSSTLVLAADNQKVDLNTATVEQLQELKGIGPALAQRIVEFRQQQGPFQSVEDLTNVKGIGEGKLKTLKDSLTIEADTHAAH